MKRLLSLVLIILSPLVFAQDNADVNASSPSGKINKDSEGVSNPNTQKVETQQERQEEEEDSFKVGPYKDGEYKYFDPDEREDTPLP